MDNLDKQIHDALNPNDRAMLGNPEDGMRFDQLMRDIPHATSCSPCSPSSTASFSLGSPSGARFRFFNSTETKALLAWGFAFTFCMTAVGMLKMWFWMEMQRIAVTREVKRVELLTAKLLERLQQHD
ncbi:MAG: DUF6768 family protein [Phycisphaerales bacterium]